MDLLGLGKVTDNGLELMKMVYPDVAQPGLQKVGQALGTVLDLGNTILLPLKLVNANATFFFQHHMDNYRKKMEAIPEENMGVVQPTLGLRIIDELLKVTNEDIAELFINLLTNASTVDKAKYAHPAFIDVINNLSADEAKIFNEIFNKYKGIVFNEIIVIYGDVPIGFNQILSDINDQVELIYPENPILYLNNLSRCGLIEKTWKITKDDLPIHEVLERRLQEDLEDTKRSLNDRPDTQVEIHKGRYEITPFGHAFRNGITSTDQYII